MWNNFCQEKQLSGAFSAKCMQNIIEFTHMSIYIYPNLADGSNTLFGALTHNVELSVTTMNMHNELTTLQPRRKEVLMLRCSHPVHSEIYQCLSSAILKHYVYVIQFMHTHIQMLFGPQQDSIARFMP